MTILPRGTIIMSKKSKLRKKYPTIKKGKRWWKNLSQEDKKAFTQGFFKNRNAEKIQKEEIEFNKQRNEQRN